jgi:hypothetical protein
MDFSVQLKQDGVAEGIAIEELVYRVRHDLGSRWHWAHELSLVSWAPVKVGEAVGGFGLPVEPPVGTWVAQRVASEPMSYDLLDLILNGTGTSPKVGVCWHPDTPIDVLAWLAGPGGRGAAVAGRQDIVTEPELLDAVLSHVGSVERAVFNVGRNVARAHDISAVLPLLQQMLPWAPGNVRQAFEAGLTTGQAPEQRIGELAALIGR